MSPKDLEDAFIKVTFEEDVSQLHAETAADDPLYAPWIDQGVLCSFFWKGCCAPVLMSAPP